MNFEEPENITLETLGGGAANEKFDIELGEVIKNILDLNYPAVDKRTITLKVHFKPSADRGFCAVIIECSSALAKKNSFSTGLHVGMDEEGNPIANMNMLKQTTFEDLQKEDAKVEPLRKVK